MAKKSTTTNNTTTAKGTTATTNNTTTMNNKKEATTMENNVNTTAATVNTTAMSAQEFKQKSYDAYLAYVSFIEGQKSIADTVEALSPLMSAYGFTLTVDNLANLLTVKMTAFGKDKGEQAKKVKSISTFRAFVKGGWQDVAAAPVHSNAGKNPADVKQTTKAKGPTKAELEEKNAALLAELEALRAAAAAKEEKAA